MSGSWWDKPAIIGHPFYSRKGDAQIIAVLAVLSVAVMILAGPLWGLGLFVGAVGTAAKHAVQRRGRPRLAGPWCTKQCRTSTEPVDGDCGCACRGVRHGQGLR